jgi:hypothetical protein
MQRYKSWKQALLGGLNSAQKLFLLILTIVTVISIVLTVLAYQKVPSLHARTATNNLAGTPTATTITDTPTPTPTPTATHTPTAIPTPSKLLVSPSSLNAKTNCSYDVHSGWTCIELLSSNRDVQSNLHWSVSGGITGTSFNPQSGTIEPGKPVRVSIFIPNTICPDDFTFSFAGTINTVHVPWSCAAPILIARPKILDGAHGCSSYVRHEGWDCYVTLSSSQDSQGGLKWYASGGITGTSFNPQSGTIEPGQSVMVTIAIRISSRNCPATSTFIFSGSSHATVSWSCA